MTPAHLTMRIYDHSLRHVRKTTHHLRISTCAPAVGTDAYQMPKKKEAHTERKKKLANLSFASLKPKG